MGSIMWKKDDKNFTLVIGDKNIKVHKFVMEERSGYFKAMFGASWKENEENQTTVEKFSYEIVEKAVKFCYDFPLIIDSEDEAKSLLEFSEYYIINNLKQEAEYYLNEKICVDNVCELANASMKFDAKNLQLFCLNFMVKCLKESTAIEQIATLNPNFKIKLVDHAFCITLEE